MPEIQTIPAHLEPASAATAEPCSCHADALLRGEVLREQCACHDDVATVPSRLTPEMFIPAREAPAPPKGPRAAEVWSQRLACLALGVVGAALVTSALMPAVFVTLLLFLLAAAPLIAVLTFMVLTIGLEPVEEPATAPRQARTPARSV